MSLMGLNNSSVGKSGEISESEYNNLCKMHFERLTPRKLVWSGTRWSPVQLHKCRGDTLRGITSTSENQGRAEYKMLLYRIIDKS